MTAGSSMPTGKTAAEIKAGMRSDRTVFAERRNRLEKVRNDFQMRLLDREKARARFVIGKERKELAKSFQSVQQTTGQSELGIPGSFHDKDVCSSEHYRYGVVISNRRLKQWRRQEEFLQKHVTKEEVKDEEELGDRQIVLNNLLAEIRQEYDNSNEITEQRTRPVKELRMPYAAQTTSLDVFENLRAEDERIDIGRPATAPVQRIRHRGGPMVVEAESVETKKSKSSFNIRQWERLITREYIDSFIGREYETIVMSNGYARPHSAHVPIQTESKAYIEPKISNGRLEMPLFIRVNKHLSEEHGILKMRPHSASLTDECRNNKHDTSRPRPKSSPLKRKSALKSNSTDTMASPNSNPVNFNELKPLTPPMTPSKSSVAFDLEPTVHDFERDDSQIANGGDADYPDVTCGRHRKSGIAMAPDMAVNSEHGGEDVDETSQEIIGTQETKMEETRTVNVVAAGITEDGSPDPLENERPSTAESSPGSRKTSSAIRKVSFRDSYRPIQRMPRGFQQDRDRKISSSSTGSSGSRRESIDILRKKHLVINLDVRGSLNKRLTNANQTESAGEDEEIRPSGPPQWRRELLRDAPPGLYSAAETPKVHLTMSKSARKKELEKMVESNTSNLRDMIISEKERRAQTRMNMQKSMAELDSIQK
ncbi:uncharacterized protein LOC135488163 [Lineus longissimus]|uniref:uncharacterized protein LOC135488163 n=1 Tax=Lineus longissimus TaxID=88925 RepID=UPI002B4DA4C5